MKVDKCFVPLDGNLRTVALATRAGPGLGGDQSQAGLAG